MPVNNEPWEKSREKDGIRIYTRETEDSKIKEFKVVAVFQTSIPKVLKVLKDINTYPDWVTDCKASKILKTINDNEIIYYLVIKIPFPLNNRDIIQHMTIGKEDNTGTITISVANLPNYIPEKRKMIRMPLSDGYWQLTPVEDDEVEVTFQFITDPGGNIPAWLVNLFIVESPFNTMKNLREQVKKAKYQKTVSG